MYLQIVKNLIKKKRGNQAQLAHLAGVSRATVTGWYKKAAQSRGWVNVETKSLKKLADGLEINPSLLLTPQDDLSQLKTTFLWDSLYPDMESFAKALAEKRLPAIARLVQIIGFNQAKQIVGNVVTKKFPLYKKFIHPARRKQCETLWPLYS